MAAQAPALAGSAGISLRSRFYGFGSIYGKTVRDSRLTFIIAAGLLGGMALVMGAAIGTVFPTEASRLEIDKLIGAMPAAMVNLFGKPEKLGTLGGYMSWKYGAIFALGTALWSIMALSGTLAGEAGKGNLDMVASTPFGKRRIALEKLAAHLTVMGLAMAVLAAMTVISSNAFGDPAMGDPIPPLSAIGFALWVGFIALFFGGLAFALGPILGRSGAAGVTAPKPNTTRLSPSAALMARGPERRPSHRICRAYKPIRTSDAAATAMIQPGCMCRIESAASASPPAVDTTIHTASAPTAAPIIGRTTGRRPRGALSSSASSSVPTRPRLLD